MKYCDYVPLYLGVYIVKSVTQNVTDKQTKTCMGHLKCGNFHEMNDLTLTLNSRKKYIVS